MKNISYQIKYNPVDFFYPITVKALHDGREIITEFVNDLNEAFDCIKDMEKDLSKIKDSVEDINYEYEK